jgi:hypothetical protein
VTQGVVTGPSCTIPPTPTWTITPTPSVTPFVAQINCGASSMWSDWLPDQNYSGGTARNPGTTHDILGTTADYMYQRYRSGSDFSYRWTNLPNGRYVVTLFFAETYYTSAGKRTFQVYLNGARVLNNFDIFAVAGHDRGTSRTFTTYVTNGTLAIRFKRIKDVAVINGIVVDGR